MLIAALAQGPLKHLELHPSGLGVRGGINTGFGRARESYK